MKSSNQYPLRLRHACALPFSLISSYRAWGYLSLGLSCFGASLSYGQAVQRAAADAFGTRIGDESVGLYSEGLVRGFSLQESGNYVLEDAYFVRGARLLTNSIISGSSVRVGPNALGFSFPSPAGVVQYRLMPDLKERTEIQLGLGDATSVNLRPLLRGYLTRKSEQQSLALGLISVPREQYANGAKADYNSLGGIWRRYFDHGLKLTTIVDFARWRRDSDLVFLPGTSGLALPEIVTQQFYGQAWNRSRSVDRNLGLMLQQSLSDWRWNVAAFESRTRVPEFGFSTFSIDSQAQATTAAFQSPGREVQALALSSTVTRDWKLPESTVSLTGMLRARRSDYVSPNTRRFATPSIFLNERFGFGAAQIAAPSPQALGAQASSAVDQDQIGIDLRWQDQHAASASVGLRRVQSRLSNRALQAQPTQRSDGQTLWNAALTWPLARSLTAFAAHNTGLEEAGFAPINASNRFEPLQPVLTRQAELGMKWQVQPQLSALAMAFDLRKPDAAIDSNNRFDYVGDVRNLGLELSLAGSVSAHTSVVAGGLWMRPRLTRTTADGNEVQSPPVGRSARIGTLSVNHSFANTPWAVDATVFHNGPRPANTVGAETSSLTSLSIGARYAFKVGDWPSQWRIRMFNAADRFSWIAQPSGSQGFIEPRRVEVLWILGE